jgi:hypothetical protein
VVYHDASGRLDTRLVSRDEEPLLVLAWPGVEWGFDVDGELFRLAAEALRRLVYAPLQSIAYSMLHPPPDERDYASRS